MLVYAANASEVERVSKENAALRQEVERLKQELIVAEVHHGGTCYIHNINHFCGIIITNTIVCMFYVNVV